MPDEKTDQVAERAAEAFSAIDAKSQAFIAEAWAQMEEGKSMRPGGGGRFAAFVGKLQKRGMSDDRAARIAAAAGRKNYGKSTFQKMAATGRKRAARKGK